MCIYIYREREIDIEREIYMQRERGRERDIDLSMAPFAVLLAIKAIFSAISKLDNDKSGMVTKADQVAPIAQLVKGRLSDAGGLRFESQAGRIMGVLRKSKFQASGGTSALQSRASGLQSATQGNSIRTKRLLRVKNEMVTKADLSCYIRGIKIRNVKGVPTKETSIYLFKV